MSMYIETLCITQQNIEKKKKTDKTKLASNKNIIILIIINEPDKIVVFQF